MTITATADPTTGTIRIDVQQTTAFDQFTRVVAASWGSPNLGPAWVTAGGAAADFSVNGTRGIMTHTAVNTPHRANMPASIGNDQENTFTAIAVPAALTQPILIDATARVQSGANLYYFRLTLNPSGVAQFQLRKDVNSSSQMLGPLVTLPWPHTAGTSWVFRFQVCGNTLKGKVWPTSVAEPNWIGTAVDFDFPTGNQAGIRTLLATGNTNVLPFNFTFDDYAAGIGNPIRLWRVTPDGVRTQVQGSPFLTPPVSAFLSTGTGAATMWDSEAPFDTSVFYELTSNCSTTAEFTSGAVTLDSDGMAWLRDPVDPTLNFAIDVDGEEFEYCDEDVNSVTFGGLDSYGYPSASGIFDTVNAQRVQNVSMVRKRYEQVLTLVSKWLDPDFDSVEAILASGRTLLLSLPPAYGFGRGTFSQDYIAVADTSASYLGVDLRLQARVWLLPFRLGYAEPFPTNGDGGNGTGGGGATYGALAASVLGTTYATLSGSGQTYAQVAQGVGY